jgi:ABC-type transport system involved in multi-copper enzyme maturation permease subunit
MADDNYTGGELTMSWRAIVLGPLVVALFFLALCLGLSFTLAMVWVILSARDSGNPDSPLRAFVPKMTTFLVLGSAFVASSRWNTDRRISAIEVGFAALYIIAGYVAVKIFDAKRNRPQLTTVKRPQRR